MSIRLPNILRRYETDALPRAFVGIGLLISAVAVAFGFFFPEVLFACIREEWGEDSAGFVLNILATLALLGPGLFITNPLVREWQQRRLRPSSEEARRYLHNLLVEIAAGCGLPTHISQPPPPHQLKTVNALCAEAGALIEEIERLARVASGPPRSLPPAVVLTVRQVDQLSIYVRRILILSSSPNAELYLQDAAIEASHWDELREVPGDQQTSIYATGGRLASNAQALMTELQKPGHPLLM
jgi:hypothetical protein